MERLTVLLAAGSTIKSGIGPKSIVRGMPSTQELTDEVARLPYPAFVRRATPFLMMPGALFPDLGQELPILPIVRRALASTFGYVDFETILHAIEQLQTLASDSLAKPLNDSFDSILSAFVEMKSTFALLKDRNALRLTKESIIEAIFTLIDNRRFGFGSQTPALHTFIQTLEKKFRLNVFTLNYDDVIDDALPDWFDGFTKQLPMTDSGRVWSVKEFDPVAFRNWRDEKSPLLAHLHGSVRFGYAIGLFGLGKFSDRLAAKESLRIGRSDKHVGGGIVSADPIISGLSKVAKLTLNPAPYGYYYNAFIDSLLENDRLLVIGYGGRDQHFNAWLEQFVQLHGNSRKVGCICYLPGQTVGDRTPEKDMIAVLAGGGKFEEFRHYHDPNNAPVFHACGRLGLVPSGFPTLPDVEQKLIDFLL